MTLLQLRIFPDSILQKISEPVDKVDDSIRKIMDDMIETMYHESGVGLAAVQIGILKRILVMDVSYGSSRYPDKNLDNIPNSIPKGKFFMANPKIIKVCKEKSIYDEGCLSFPTFGSKILRPKSVEVEYLDYYNKKQILKTKDNLLTVCVQHEIDHLNGITFIDHISRLKREILIKKITKYNIQNNAKL